MFQPKKVRQAKLAARSEEDLLKELARTDRHILTLKAAFWLGLLILFWCFILLN